MSLWGGRFQGTSDADAWKLNASIDFDQRLAKQDVAGSIAWAQQLHEIGILNVSEFKDLLSGLTQILNEFENLTFQYQPGDEDIHSAVERRLYEIIGSTAGKLHTGRSRNDQVSTDFRLWLLESIPILIDAIRQFQSQLVKRAEQDINVVMPSYTHLQRAQPVLLSHWWLSFFWPLERDVQRLLFTLKECGIMPLGSGAAAGTGFPVDRNELANQLGFIGISQNSMDAVSDRDFAAQFLFDAAMCGIHLSKLAEQVVMFTSAEFGFFALDDAFSTGSSLMPQKKNPDVFELTRGKAGNLLGLLTGLMSTLKGLPSTYDKDLQEDKQAVFQAYDILMAVLPVLSKAIPSLKIFPEKLRAAIDPSVFATDLADLLVKAGIPFREAHTLIGNAVKMSLESGRGIHQLTRTEWKKLIPDIEVDFSNVFSPEASISTRCVVGGTAPQVVVEQISTARRCLQVI
ncbi:MAG: argininosuccinate lyase [Chloroflexi bacterium HGW-Chloroflexi-3]|nr:MAG: argininosuccinate lyase [Chloroflexi bacterium HGW-Chloroflexi-3]